MYIVHTQYEENSFQVHYIYFIMIISFSIILYFLCEQLYHFLFINANNIYILYFRFSLCLHVPIIIIILINFYDTMFAKYIFITAGEITASKSSMVNHISA